MNYGNKRASSPAPKPAPGPRRRFRINRPEQKQMPKVVTLKLTQEQETVLAVMLITEAGRAEDRARRIEHLKPGSTLSERARQFADARLDVYNQFNIARNMPTVTADEI